MLRGVSLYHLATTTSLLAVTTTTPTTSAYRTSFTPAASTSSLNPFSWIGASAAYSPPVSSAMATEPNFLPHADKTLPYETFTGAAGCFWGVEKLFRKENPRSLRSTSVGYISGVGEQPENRTTPPTYREVCQGTTPYQEAIQVEFFPDKISYAKLCEFFYSIHDPTQKGGQGNDIGQQYISAIYPHSAEQKTIAEKVQKMMGEKYIRGSIATRIFDPLATTAFHRAEVYHQLYLEKNPNGYCAHRKHFQLASP